ncbi:hypothetical protein HID58_046253 [Brassica napus]|uniref:Uncharacterized protein n=2 Tax=Brassica TaxID=3705 RepID=A0ABQ8AVW2_BRANA|nr:hypothetical protein HID58_046253 [Brassica napus]
MSSVGGIGSDPSVAKDLGNRAIGDGILGSNGGRDSPILSPAHRLRGWSLMRELLSDNGKVYFRFAKLVDSLKTTQFGGISVSSKDLVDIAENQSQFQPIYGIIYLSLWLDTCYSNWLR